MSGPSRADFERLDRDDPLASLRDAFRLPEGLIYSRREFARRDARRRRRTRARRRRAGSGAKT